MISLYDATTPRGLRLPVVYNGLTLNSPSDVVESTSSAPEGYPLSAVASKTALDYILEIQAQRPGAEIYNMHKITRVVTLVGRVVGSTRTKLHDKIEAMAAAFDPDTIFFNNADPFLPMTFSTLATGGTLACKYLCIPGAVFEPVVGPGGLTARINMPMLMKDPRRYLQAITTKTGNQTFTNAGDFRSWPTLTITMAGAGNVAYRITNTAPAFTTFLVLDLSGRINGDVVVVDFLNRTIKVNGTLNMALYVSGDWTQVEPGSNALVYTNTTNATSVLTFYPAYSI